MTRAEEIKKEAIDYSEIEDNFMEYDDCGDVCDDKSLVEKAFVQGAEWADKTMIEKACEWLQAKNKMYMFEIGMILGKNFIEDFRKAMEE